MSRNLHAPHPLIPSTKKPLAVAVASALAAFPLWQDAKAQQRPVEELTVIGQTDNYAAAESTSYKYTQPILDTPKTMMVITSDLMRDRNADSLQDALRNVSGITLAAGEGGTPTGDQVTIRGFDARNDIMIDGIRDISGYTRDMFNVEAVEVAKGPGSAVYGRGATGGNINLQTKSARLDEFADVTLRGGSEGDYRASLDYNRPLGSAAAMRLNVMTADGDVAGRNEVFNSSDGLAIGFATGIETESRFYVSADFLQQDNLPDYGLPWVPNQSGFPDRVMTPELAPYEGMAPPVSYEDFYGNVYRDFEDIDASSLTARYERDLNATTSLRAQLRSGSVERQSVVTAPRFAFETVAGIRIYGPEVTLADEKTRDTKDSLDALQLDLLGRYDTGAIHHDLVTGIEFADEGFLRHNFVDIVDDNLDSTPELNMLGSPNPRIAYTGVYGRDGTSTLAEGRTTAIYAFDTMSFGPRWELTLGLRHDRFESDYQYDYADPSLRIAAVNEETSWSVGTVFKPAERGTIYFGAGTSFNPSAEDLTASAGGNDNELDPEESISYEFGTKWEMAGGRLLTSAALFRTEKTNARTDDPFDSGNLETLNGVQRVDGIEFGATGQITSQFSVSASLTLQDSEVVKAEGSDAALVGYELARTPEESFSLWGRYDLSERWSAALGAQHIGERYNSSDPAGRELAEAYTIYDMMLAYRVNGRMGLRLNASNLTDESYVNQVGGGHFAPGDGRSYWLSADLSF